jgi:hypothetical protein
VPQLLVDLLAQVTQSLEVLARVADPGLGLPAALLVARDAGGLLQKSAHLLRARLDHPRDHVLLDDGVTARAESGAEKELRDVLAAAAHTVKEIG